MNIVVCLIGSKAGLQGLDARLVGGLRMETQNGVQRIVAVFIIVAGVVLSAMVIIGNFTAHDLGADIPINNAKIQTSRGIV